MLKAIRVSALLLALTGSAYAGEMLTPPAPQQPPTQASAAQEPTATDEDTTGAAETLTQIALEMVSSVLSLL